MIRVEIVLITFSIYRLWQQATWNIWAWTQYFKCAKVSNWGHKCPSLREVVTWLSRSRLNWMGLSCYRIDHLALKRHLNVAKPFSFHEIKMMKWNFAGLKSKKVLTTFAISFNQFWSYNELIFNLHVLEFWYLISIWEHRSNCIGINK